MRSRSRETSLPEPACHETQRWQLTGTKRPPVTEARKHRTRLATSIRLELECHRTPNAPSIGINLLRLPDASRPRSIWRSPISAGLVLERTKILPCDC